MIDGTLHTYEYGEEDFTVSPFEPEGVTFDEIPHMYGLPETYTTSGDASFFVQDAVSYDEGGLAAQAGLLEAGEESVMTAEVTLTEYSDIIFQWKISEGDKEIELFVDGVVETRLNGLKDAGDWQEYRITMLSGDPSGDVHTLSWVYARNDAGKDLINATAWVDEAQISEAIHGFDFTKYKTLPLSAAYTTYTTSQDDTAFFLQNGEAHDAGGFAAQSGIVGVGETSFMEREINLASDTPVSFWWKVDSTEGNAMKLYVDGALVSMIEGVEEVWKLVTVDISSGVHTLRWEYDKQVADEGTLDAAWIDDFAIGELEIDNFAYPEGTVLPLASVYSTSSANPFFLQNTNALNAIGFAAQAGPVTGTGTSWMEREIDLFEGNPVSFWWKVNSAQGNSMNFYLDGELIKSIEGQGDNWQFVSVDVDSGIHTLRWVYEKTNTDTAGTLDTGWMDELRIGYMDIEAFNYPEGTILPLPAGYTTSATGGFINQNVYAHDEKGFATQAGLIAGTGTSWMEHAFTLTQREPASFWWKLDSTAGNSMKFYVDGVLTETRILPERSTPAGWILSG